MHLTEAGAYLGMAVTSGTGDVGNTAVKAFVALLLSFALGFMLGGETSQSNPEPAKQLRCVGGSVRDVKDAEPTSLRSSTLLDAPSRLSTSSLQPSVPFIFPNTASNERGMITLDPDLENREIVPFYIYDDDVHNPDLCYKEGGYTSMDLPRKGYWCTGTEWTLQARSHPWRVMDPSKARIFVIPLDVCESLATQASGKCKGKTHVDRVNDIFEAVRNSPWYKRSGGRDHFWSITHNTLPPAMLGKKKWAKNNFKHAFFPNPPQNELIKNMSIGRYCSYHLTHNDLERVGFKPQQRDWLREEEKWGCTVVMPIVTPRPLWSPDTHTFEDWEKRKHFIFFRGNNGLGGGCYMKNGEKARAKAAEFGKKNYSWYGKNAIMTNKHAAGGKEAYFTEIRNSQYCLVFTCDDPQTSRYFDAVAAGCIPVVINDAWRVSVAPFQSQINYDRFTVTVPESVWMGDPAAAIHLLHHHPRGALRRRYEAMLKARPEIMWRHPQSNVATRALREINECFEDNFQTTGTAIGA